MKQGKNTKQKVRGGHYKKMFLYKKGENTIAALIAATFAQN